MIRLFLAWLLFMWSPVSHAAPQHSVFTHLLSAVVKGESVDYRLARTDHRLNAYLKQIATQAVPKQRDAALAWWLNAYNAHTLRRVLLYYPNLSSVSTIEPKFAFFDTVDSKVGGALYSLNQIEHNIIRKTFGDYRIHAALNCASVSCPPLQPFAFEAQTLDTQLQQVFSRFIHDRTRNPGRRDASVFISSIFRWYAEDFGGLKGIRRLLGKAMPGVDTARIDYAPYDWSLNEYPVKTQ